MLPQQIAFQAAARLPFQILYILFELWMMAWYALQNLGNDEISWSYSFYVIISIDISLPVADSENWNVLVALDLFELFFIVESSIDN